jgi:hypothetical protein
MNVEIGTFLGPNGTRFARAISGPKKSRLSGPTPSKTIMYRAIKTTGTLLKNAEAESYAPLAWSK